jgi:hypothetical protein
MKRKAIATLIRTSEPGGNQWFNRIVYVRNESIKRNLKVDSNNVDFIFFHEIGFREEDKKDLLRDLRSREIHNKVKFIEVGDFKPTTEKFNSIKNDLIDENIIHTGYSSMCRFWSYGFMKYLDEYDYVIRIDDDCIALSDVNLIFDELETRYISFPYLSGENFRPNLKEFIKSYFTKTYPDREFEESERIRVPYTNYCGFNLNLIKQNEIIMNFFKLIEQRDYIYKYTWQDTQLWGLIIKYMLTLDDWSENKKVKYIHMSHLSYVN